MNVLSLLNGILMILPQTLTASGSQSNFFTSDAVKIKTLLGQKDKKLSGSVGFIPHCIGAA